MIYQRDGKIELDDGASNGLEGPVAAVSLVSDIAERFRQAVINGSLRPGDEINESQLAEKLGVARGTLREALRVLSGEGLLEKTRNRASRVRLLSAEKIWEIMTARAVIEGFGARVLAQRLTPEKVQTLNRVWERLNAAAEAEDTANFLHWDFRLHQTIMELSHHQVLYETWTRMSAWWRLMFASEHFEPEDLRRNAVLHKAFIDAIASGDPDLAEARLKADLLDQQELERFVRLAGVIAGAESVDLTAGSAPAAKGELGSPRR